MYICRAIFIPHCRPLLKKDDVFVEIFIKYNLINDRMKPQRMQVYNADFS